MTYTRPRVIPTLATMALLTLLCVGGCADEAASSEEGGSGIVPAVSVKDQALLDPTKVIIATVVSDGAGFLVVHSDEGGDIGGVRGLSAVDSGSSSEVEVTLDPPAADGETLYAMLHTDANGDGAYDSDVDVPVEDDDDEVITPSFQVTVEGSAVPTGTVAASDQTLDAATAVEIDEVVSSGPGILVIHESNADGDSFAGIIGSAAVPAGTSADVEVTLDRDAVDGETLWAMLHVDAAGNGVYDADVDGPVLEEDGDVVVTAFVVTLP